MGEQLPQLGRPDANYAAGILLGASLRRLVGHGGSGPRRHIRLAPPRRRATHKAIAGKTRNPKMTAEMQQVERADVSIQGDQVEIFRRRDQHHHSRHIHVSEVNPQVGLAGAKGVVFAVGSDQVPPSGGLVLPANEVQLCGVIEARARRSDSCVRRCRSAWQSRYAHPGRCRR